MAVGRLYLVAASNSSLVSDANHVLQAAFFEATCQEIDPNEKTIVACFPPDSSMDESCFKIPYDMLVLGEEGLSLFRVFILPSTPWHRGLMTVHAIFFSQNLSHMLQLPAY